MMALCGVLCAGIHDMTLLVVCLMCGGRFAAALADLGLGMLLAAGVTRTALMLRIDPFRLYALLGAGAGVLIWQASGGRMLRRMRRAMGRRRAHVQKSTNQAE